MSAKARTLKKAPGLLLFARQHPEPLRLSNHPKRLPHVITRTDWTYLLAPTYAKAQSVDEDIALERLQRAVHSEHLLNELYGGLAAAMDKARGLRTSEDDLIDKLSKGIEKRRGRVKAMQQTPGLSAVLVRVDLEIGHAPEMMRDALLNPKGAALLRSGLEELGSFLFKELVK
jgi:hypothetical protein